MWSFVFLDFVEQYTLKNILSLKEKAIMDENGICQKLTLEEKKSLVAFIQRYKTCNARNAYVLLDSA